MQRSRESLPDPHAARICDAQPSAQEPSGFVVELFADFRADQTPILRSLLHFLGIDNLLEDRQICGPSLSATGAALRAEGQPPPERRRRLFPVRSPVSSKRDRAGRRRAFRLSDRTHAGRANPSSDEAIRFPDADGRSLLAALDFLFKRFLLKLLPTGVSNVLLNQLRMGLLPDLRDDKKITGSY